MYSEPVSPSVDSASEANTEHKQPAQVSFAARAERSRRNGTQKRATALLAFHPPASTKGSSAAAAGQRCSAAVGDPAPAMAPPQSHSRGTTTPTPPAFTFFSRPASASAFPALLPRASKRELGRLLCGPGLRVQPPARPLVCPFSPPRGRAPSLTHRRGGLSARARRAAGSRSRRQRQPGLAPCAGSAPVPGPVGAVQQRSAPAEVTPLPPAVPAPTL